MLQEIKPLHEVTETHGTTNEAAHWLKRKPGTLRRWVSAGKGPIRPVKVNGQFLWPVAAIKRLMGVA